MSGTTHIRIRNNLKQELDEFRSSYRSKMSYNDALWFLLTEYRRLKKIDDVINEVTNFRSRF